MATRKHSEREKDPHEFMIGIVICGNREKKEEEGRND